MPRQPTSRRLAIWIALVFYALVVSGLPLPLGAVSVQGRSDGVGDQLLAAKDRSRPFPCRDKPCGCVSAEQCFKKCCCHTPAQLLAWARRHDVEPAVLTALARRTADEAPQIASAASCCATPAIAARATCCTPDAPAAPPQVVTVCCLTGHAPVASVPAPAASGGDVEPHPPAEICSDYRSLAAAGEPTHHRGAAADDDPRDEPVDEPVSRHTVVLRALLACGGIAAEWFSIGGAPPPPAVIAVACVSPLAVTLVVLDEAPRPRRVAPDVPPPRVA